ncbi:chitobiase/beta-hexosaminidase C-terminal domain-containing protein [Paenibacillus sp. HWE-109]|uniref:chitobiase/beta-hexosaminidase C-terminal domain-containing protein n=1 Tax=Paenibacillus sp. HWE-109 TaxID=1306526 RepID=UPI001EDDE2C4|nr:chitobiase/beta-hexosaminidase C-terminal domain-containing protein [Paenibacillus sp. HWE-109]UKS30163.1 chitobiase/beta-hexosaminidase C-terminal domain-containing protein [Paenibacillus sp. HWE-109]
MTFDSSKPLKRAGAYPVPQYWNDETGDWEVVKGSAGAYRLQTTEKVAREPFSGNSTLTKEFSQTMTGFTISNDGNADLTFTILNGDGAGDTYRVYAGAVFGEDMPAFTRILITTTVPFQAYGKVSSGTANVAPNPVDTTAPDNVTNLVSSGITQTSLTLGWAASASSDCVGYEVYRGSTLLATVNGTAYNVTGLTQATQYTFTVKAKDAANNIASGTSVTATTATQVITDTTPPTITVSPAAGTFTTTQSVTLSANETATIYYTLDGSTPTTSNAVYSAPIVINATTTLKFFGRDSAGNLSTVQTALYTINLADTTPPAAVTNLVVGTPTSSAIPVSWTASISTDTAKYEIAYSMDGTNYTVANANVTAMSYSVAGLNASTQYTIRVVAIDTSGNRSTTNLTVQATTTSGGYIVASDTFNRADGALGNSETGGSWNVSSGNVATIINNQAGFLASSSTYPNLTITQSDNVDIEIDMVMPTLVTGNISGVSSRVNSTNNQGLIFGALVAGTKVGFLTTLAGAATVPATANFSFVAGQTYRIKLEVRGNVYKGYIDGVLIQTYTDSNNIGLSNTKHGFVFYSTAVPRGDNFRITAY